MNRILFILAFLTFVSCTNEEKEAVDSIDDTEKKDDVPIINGFGCEVDFNEEGYVIRVSKDNNFLFEVSEDIGKGSKQYIDLGYGNKMDIIVSDTKVLEVLQYENTYYLLADIRDKSYANSFWGIRKLFSYEKGKVHMVTLNSSFHLPTNMKFWFENSIVLSENISLYPEATASEGHVYDNDLNLISKYSPNGKPLDLYHVISVSGGGSSYAKNPLMINWYDIRNSSHYIWQYMCDINNNDFVINSWDASYSSNNTVLVTVNITYITGEKEVLNLEFDKETGELVK